MADQPKLVDKINAAIKANDTVQGRVPMGQGPVLTPARTYLSPTDSYEDQISQDNPTVSLKPGQMRAMWSVAEQQNASVPSTVLTSSGNSSNNAISAIQGGIAQNPVAPSTQWAAVPSMILSVRVQAPVMIMGNVSVLSSVANDTAGFAIYRDGQIIGNHLTQTMPATASTAALVQLNAMDSPSPGNHVYALYWSPGTGTLVANSNQRNLYVVNLLPQ